MGSREKLALFNMLTEYLPGATVLDAFAGTGALGLEALSRGATKVVFIEKSAQNAKLIAENLRSLGLTGTHDTKIITKPIEQTTLDETFDIIIADPPYDNFNLDVVNYLTQYLKPTGIFVLSHPKLPTTPALQGLQLLDARSYAAANLAFYHKV